MTPIQRFPRILFNDDNQGMSSVACSGRNPTMRHLERAHEISICSLHEHFQCAHFVLMSEITSKMAADIHTKGFKNPLAWQRACVLINLISPSELGTRQLAKMVAPTTDVDTTTRQAFQSKTLNVPNFPYTETLILPPQVFAHGFAAREGLPIVQGCDPIFAVKTPVLFRRLPSGTGLPADCLRSTWILVNGRWQNVKDHVPPLQQQDRFDRWV